MQIKVLLFGQLQELFGKAEIILSEIYSTQALLVELERQNPSLGKYTFSIALNENIIKSNESLKANDIIALLPPFAGG